MIGSEGNSFPMPDAGSITIGPVAPASQCSGSAVHERSGSVSMTLSGLPGRDLWGPSPMAVAAPALAPVVSLRLFMPRRADGGGDDGAGEPAAIHVEKTLRGGPGRDRPSRFVRSTQEDKLCDKRKHHRPMFR